MLFRESKTIELKKVVVDDIKKEIIAFANCDGGKLYIGIRDDGTVDFGLQQMCTLKLIDQDNLYSNLGLLLSDQCVHTIKVAVFQGTDQTIFKEHREFTGSLMQQMNEVYDFIEFRNQTRATI